MATLAEVGRKYPRAALSVRHVASRWSGFGRLVRRAPYLSGVVILAVGVYVGLQGWLALTHAA